MRTRLLLHTGLVFLTTGALAACGPEDKAAGGDGDGTGGGGTGASDGAGTSGATGGSGDPTTASSSGGTGTGGSGDGSTGQSFVGGSTSGGDDPGPNGSECFDGSECMSMKCYDVGGLGAFCSECESDADCMTDGGAGTCAYDFGLGYAVCTDGNAGDMCDSDEGCMGELVCGSPLGPGTGFNFCSECKVDGDCGEDQRCTNVFEDMGLGYLGCVDIGAAEDGQGCPLTDGDEVCASGHCGTVTLFGMLELGMCGECSSDDDCPGGTCTPGEFGMGGRTPATCDGGTGGGTTSGGTTDGGTTGGGTTDGGTTDGGTTGGSGTTDGTAGTTG